MMSVGGGGSDYIAGTGYNFKDDNPFAKITNEYEKEFSSEEIRKLLIGGGLLYMNLKKMREDGMEVKCVAYLKQNAHRLKQAEQDVLNLVCYPKIKLLPERFMVCTYLYDMIENNEFFGNEITLGKQDKVWIKEALNKPIQLHYAGAQKPWNTPTCTKSDVWFSYLLKTPFFYEVMRKITAPKLPELPDCKFYLWNKIEIIKIKNGKARLFGFMPIAKKKRFLKPQ